LSKSNWAINTDEPPVAHRLRLADYTVSFALKPPLTMIAESFSGHSGQSSKADATHKIKENRWMWSGSTSARVTYDTISLSASSLIPVMTSAHRIVYDFSGIGIAST
jgi:hypothetical protein